jgi:hypothetical protein
MHGATHDSRFNHEFLIRALPTRPVKTNGAHATHHRATPGGVGTRSPAGGLCCRAAENAAGRVCGGGCRRATASDAAVSRRRASMHAERISLCDGNTRPSRCYLRVLPPPQAGRPRRWLESSASLAASWSCTQCTLPPRPDQDQRCALPTNGRLPG